MQARAPRRCQRQRRWAGPRPATTRSRMVTTTAKINPATPTVTVTDPLPTFDGSPHSAAAVTKGLGGADVSGSFTFTYDGGNTAPTHAKTSYAVVATFTSSDGNYTDASGTGVLTINKASSTTAVTVAGGVGVT